MRPGIFGWDLPPGVSVNDLPGNRPEDALWERAADIVAREHPEIDDGSEEYEELVAAEAERMAEAEHDAEMDDGDLR